MKLDAMVDERLVKFDFDGRTKDDVLKAVAKLMYNAGKVSDYDAYVKGLYEREKEFATGIGNGIAIPHCKSECVREAAFTLVKLKNDIEWGSLDDLPVNYIIMLAAPEASDNIHLEMLAKLSYRLMDDDFRDGLINAVNIKDIYDLLKDEEE